MLCDLEAQANNGLLNGVKTLACAGVPVFPLDKKVPTCPGGFQAASTDLSQIDRWWRDGSSWNVGVPTGSATGFVVLDVDNKPRGANGFVTLADLEALHGPLPATVMQKTGYGVHHLFRYPEEGVRCSAGRLGPGLDVRGDGGYILVPPSVHPDTGASYDWLPGHAPWEIALAEVPRWLLDRLKPDYPAGVQPAALVRSSSRYGEAALAGECARIEAALDGAQERTLNSAAFAIGQLIAAGHLVEAEALEGLRASALKMASYDQKRPWKTCEIDQKIRRAVSQGMHKPRRAR